MATTKKSTKAKSNTTKKPAAKKTQASAKTTKKSVSTKAVKPAASAKKLKNGKQTLMQLNILSAFVAAAGAVAAGLLMGTQSYQLTTGLIAKDELTGALIPAVHAVTNLELRWGVVAIMVLAAIVPLLAATRSRKMYEESLDKKVMLWRWIDLAVISALMVGVVALLSGVQDIVTLKVLGGLMIVTCLLAWKTEKQNAGAAKPFWGTYVLGLITGALPWLLIATYAVGTGVWGRVRAPWYVYALYAALLLAFGGYALNQYSQLKNKLVYEFVEKRYLMLNIAAKAAFAAILIVGLQK